eukprot:scaffold72415_cov27-Cyclotella_meneghiniana.AAC.2
MNVLKAAFAVFIVVGANARKPSEGPFQQQTSPSHSTVNQTRSRNLSCEPAPIAAKVKVKSTTGSSSLLMSTLPSARMQLNLRI